jgi:hypothetical protein
VTPRSTAKSRPANSARPVSAGTVPIAAPNTGTEIAANASERVQTERASRRSAGAEGEDEVIRVDISVGSVYLAIVPCRDLIDKRPFVRPFRDRVYSDA